MGSTARKATERRVQLRFYARSWSGELSELLASLLLFGDLGQNTGPNGAVQNQREDGEQTKVASFFGAAARSLHEPRLDTGTARIQGNDALGLSLLMVGITMYPYDLQTP